MKEGRVRNSECLETREQLDNADMVGQFGRMKLSGQLIGLQGKQMTTEDTAALRRKRRHYSAFANATAFTLGSFQNQGLYILI